MARYIFAGLISLACLVLSTAVHASIALGRVVASGFEVAFSAEAVRERLPVAALQTEAVTYGAARARTRSFRARIDQRHDLRAGFGALGIPAAA